ncbi:TetR/AcrR family transcriptional regulator [Mesorhizobium sp. CAU 1741]|uniref:TetR/AcrR family transcriptional regulator n=1 Tax=Mesorhizobium sp. CAU 1741 TaxID=3140366 RepID=UPI00325BF1E8
MSRAVDGNQSAQKPRKRRRKSAEQVAKTEATRRKLLQATAEVIGEQGFGKATIDAITQRAEIAHGAFYLYFSSRQDAFDQVLATLGEDLLSAIAENVRDSHDIAELEQRGLEANIAFSETHPYMHRVMTEAELFAPDAYRTFMQNLRERYVRSLRRSLKAGQLAGFREDELEAVAVLLMGLRRALIHAYCLDGWTVKQPAPAVYETLSKLIVHGLRPSSDVVGDRQAGDDRVALDGAARED